MRRTLLELGLALLLGVLPLSSQADNAPSTEAVFEQSKQRFVQLRILEKSANEKTSLGSGFIVNSRGQIITNYHVISDLVFRPDLYRGEVFYSDSEVRPLKVVNVDVIHDLAVVETGRPANDFFQIEPTAPPKGTRVYAIGTPHDLGFTIVEGTYNGLLVGSLYEKIHYTGAINSGMSGGPAILGDGRVVGINVATAGNQIGFLVPATYALRLLQQKPYSGTPLNAVRDQLLANQARISSSLLKQALPTTLFHGYRVPSTLGNFSKCWADTDQSGSQLYRRYSQQCSSEDDIFLYGDSNTGKLSFQHDYLEAPGVNRFRFYNLYQQFFAQQGGELGSALVDVGSFACQTDFVAHNKLKMRVALCLRPYKRLSGLYDMVLKLATLNENQRGLQSTYAISGINFDNSRLLTRQFIEAFAWQN
ncbi:S1C family serine protease [Leeia sp.]|uniref:S1C family serine protease n=1 Tax=Leeia sp. TaxID=2884678 RepID=UPI0035B3B6EC